MKTFSLDEIQTRLVKLLNTETKLYSLGHAVLDPYYKVMLGNCTDITGYPYSGKTLFLMEILYNLSELHGFKHLLHLPDSGKPEEVMAILLQKVTGKTFDKRYENVISEEEIYKNINWIDEHFKILSAEKRPSPIEFWEFSNTLDVQTACIDSWNYMRHDGSGTEYLAQTLSTRNELAEKYNKHFFTIIHPRNPNKEDKDSDGNNKPPTAYNLMGGSEWNNNGKNIIVLDCTVNESFHYDVYFRKIKPRMVGKTGFESLHFDIISQRFYTVVDGKKVFANGDKVDFKYSKEMQEIIQPDGGMKNFKEEIIPHEEIKDINGKIVPF